MSEAFLIGGGKVHRLTRLARRNATMPGGKVQAWRCG